MADFNLILNVYRGYDKGTRRIHMRLLHQNPPVTMNVKKIRRLMPKLYQYTAIDEATRIRCRVIFDEHSSWNTVRFLHYVRKKFPFEIKCVQTDNGTEFTNALLNPGKLSEFEQYLNKERITHKRIRPATPRHNGNE